MPITLWIILILATILRIILSSLYPITADEAYYWLWSKHLALSYVDHPPLVAYINYLFTLGKENLLMLRLAPALFALGTSIVIYFLGKKLFNEKVAFHSALLFQFIPHFFFIWQTMFVDVPMVFFWSLALLLLVNQRWIPLATALGLGYLSKYTMLLFIPCSLFIYRKRELLYAFLFSFLFFIPVLYWNLSHNWISFAFHLGRAGGESFGNNTLSFIAEQLIQFNPLLVILLIPALIKAYKEKQILFYFSAPIFILFLLLSLKVKIWPHWPSIGYIAAIPLTVDYLINKKQLLFRSFMIFMVAFILLIFAVLFFIDPGLINKQREYKQNYKISEKLPPNLKVFATNHASVSILEFYLKRPVYLIPKNKRTSLIWGEKQFDIWQTPQIKKRESVILYAANGRIFADDFKKISLVKNVKLVPFEDYIGKFKFYRLENYQGP